MTPALRPRKATGNFAGFCQSTAAVCLCAAAAVSIPLGDALAKSQHKTGFKHNSRQSERAGSSRPPAAQNGQVLTRAEILSSDPARIERIGRRLVVGYHDFADVKALVEHKAIAGVFITDHNVRNRKPAAIKADIDALQAIRVTQGMPPLVVAADQEGGSVSRLSPPLKRQPSLARLLSALRDDPSRQAAVEKFAAEQACELKKLGVTLNFSPVVDLKPAADDRKDGETRLRHRAIASDPDLVAKVAGWYCATLAQADLMCTLKHFPGLGRVKRDTHVTTGEITASEVDLVLKDWVPFRQLMDRRNVVTMLGHVRIRAIDATTPASYSEVVIRSLMRDRWGHAGLVITDDFSMGAVTRSADGVGGAAVKALRAGADLILVSFSEKHYNSIMSALLRADLTGAIDGGGGAKARDRIGKAVGSPATTAQ